jgi:hypothetical protein
VADVPCAGRSSWSADLVLKEFTDLGAAEFSLLGWTGTLLRPRISRSASIRIGNSMSKVLGGTFGCAARRPDGYPPEP